MKKQNWMLLALAGTFTVAQAGCASKGFVRDEMTLLDAKIERLEQDMEAGDSRASATADDALARASEAMLRAEASGRWALGEYDYEIVDTHTVYFDFDSVEITDSASATLNSISRQLQDRPDYVAAVHGFADPKGSAAYNHALADRRANAVIRYLANSAQTLPTRFVSVSYGEDVPSPGGSFDAAGFDTDESRRNATIWIVERTPIEASGSETAAVTIEQNTNE